MKKLLLVIASVVLLAGSPMFAGVFYDDFNRENSLDLGPDWNSTSEFSIYENQVSSRNSSTVERYVTVAGLDLPSAYSVAVTLNTTEAEAFGGLVFNEQDNGEYYMMRYRHSGGILQFAQITSGGWVNTQTFSGVTPSGTYTDLDLQVDNDGAGNFTVTISDGSTSNSYTWTDTSMTGGSAGMFVGSAWTSGGVTNRGTWLFDDFTVIPEPITMALLAIGGVAGLIRRRRK